MSQCTPERPEYQAIPTLQIHDLQMILQYSQALVVLRPAGIEEPYWVHQNWRSPRGAPEASRYPGRIGRGLHTCL